MKKIKKHPILFKTAKLIKNKQENHLIYLKFPFDFKTLSFVRSLANKKYHPDNKSWTLPVSLDTLENIKEYGFKLDNHLENMLSPLPVLKTNFEIPNFKGELYNYQKEGVAFLELKDGRALIADEMGLGKTIQTIAYMTLHPELRPAIIICPASVKYNWKNEIRKFSNITNINILCGTELLSKISIDDLLTNPNFPLGEILILNYDIVKNWSILLTKLNPKLLILDEIHYIKNNTAKRTKIIKKLAKNIPKLIGLSGMPILNRPIEIFNVIHLINPSQFFDRWIFAKKYCNLRYNGYGWDFNGHSNTQELNKLLTKTVMLRRLKKDVLKELPDKTFSIIPMEINNCNEYKYAEENFIEFVRKSKGDKYAIKAKNAKALTEIEGLKQLSTKGKLYSVIEWIDDFLKSGEKLIIFCHHKFIVKELFDRFIKIAVKLDGSTKAIDRDKAINTFQNDPNISLFIGTKAAGIGINLTAASNIAIIEFPWTPGDLMQWIDRCHRIGQKNAVNVYYMPAYRTIEEKIIKILGDKMKVLSSILDGESIDTIPILHELLNEYTY